MNFIFEYRRFEDVRRLAGQIAKITTRNWTIMEICGGQTHSILRFGIDQLLPDKITLVHGPGCPVCVTAVETVDKAIMLAERSEVIFCSFGDMLRVPGSQTDLLAIKAKGGDVRVVYSPLDALTIASENPGKKVVFFGIGFETTAPSTAATVYQAAVRKIENFFLLSAHVLVIPAMEAILSQRDNLVQGFLAAGHVCTITGYAAYESVAKKYKVPIVVTGFEPLDLLQGIYHTVALLEKSEYIVENHYARSVRREGNPAALQLMDTVFETTDRAWRGLGVIPHSGLRLRSKYAAFDAELYFGLQDYHVQESTECRSGEVLKGVLKPDHCPLFGNRCTPEHPLGATMVSSEGACAAYYRYRKQP